MTEKQLISEMAEKLGTNNKDSKNILDTLTDIIVDKTMTEGSVTFGKLGTFKKSEVAAKPSRQGRNPKTGEAVTISAKPARSKLTFSFSKSSKEIGK